MAGQLLAYPQALAKQVDLTERLPLESLSQVHSYMAPDIVFHFNTARNWNLVPNAKVGPGTRDLQRIMY